MDKNTHRNPYDQPADLGKLLNMSSLFGKAIDGFGGEYGNAILSNLSVVDKRHLIFKTFASGEYRSVVAVRTKIGKKYLWFATVHLDFKKDELQMMQMRELKEFLKLLKRDFPQDFFILTGDFNSVPHSGLIVEFNQEGEWLDIWKECGKGIGGTFPSWLIVRKRIDYLFVSKGVVPVECKVVCSNASDHCQVVAKVKLL